MALSAPAHADEDNSKADSPEPLQEVVVTGLRQSLESAQAIKKNSEQIVESVTAQDIGALPDRSVSEALQRIPGITLQRTSNNRDPARLAGEGGGVFIRGLSWVRSEANGRDIFSANNGRALSFEDVSADLLSGINVYKNPSADLIEGGIGGTVDLRTRLPFDSAKPITAFSADYNYADLREKGFLSANALYSNQWESGIGRIGGLLSVSVGNVGNRTDSVQTGAYVPVTLQAETDGLPAGTTVYVPNSLGWRRIDWQQKRTAVAAALQLAPTDELSFTLQGLYARANPKDIERAVGEFDPATVNSTFTFDDQNVAQTGTWQNFKLNADTRYGETHNRTADVSLNAKFVPNDRWTISGDVQYVTSHADVTSLTVFTGLSDTSGSLDFDLSGNTPYVSFNQPAQTDQSAYWWAAAMDHIEDNDAHEWAERLDADFAFDDNPWLQSFRLGVRATDKAALTRQTGYNWSLLSQQFWGPAEATAVPLNSHASSSSELFKFDNFFRGNVPLPGVAWFPTAGLVNHGSGYTYAQLKDTETAGWGWAPLTAADYAKATPQGDNVAGGINDQGEETQALYGMLRFAHDTSPLGPLDGNIGVRLVRTSVDSVGSLIINAPQNATAPDDCIAANGLEACQTLINAYLFYLGGNVAGIAHENKYTDVLPTMNLRFHLNQELQLRFALGKAIVRPTFTQMMPYTSLTYDFAGTGYTPSAVNGITGTAGNPNLKPTRANQFDTSLEWYFTPTGSITFAGFYKDIRDYIYIGSSDETYTSNGITQTFRVERATNGDKGKIKGFELAYTQFYDRLPGILSGLGLQANFTYVDSTGGRNQAVNVNEPEQIANADDRTLPLEGMSKTSYNLTGLYERYKISARLAYNWRERYLLTTSAANIKRPVWSEDYGQLDGSVFYSFTSSLKLGLEATNLLNTRTYLDVGGAVLAPRYSWTDTDRRIAVAMRAQF